MKSFKVEHAKTGEKHTVYAEQSRSGFGLTLTLWGGEEEAFIAHTSGQNGTNVISAMIARVDSTTIPTWKRSMTWTPYTGWVVRDQELRTWMRQSACDIAEMIGTYLTLGSQAKIADCIAEFLVEGL